MAQSPHILETGSLSKYTTNLAVQTEYEVRMLDASYLSQMIDLQQYIMDTLENKDFYVPDPPDYLARNLGQEGFTIGVIVDGELIAYRVVVFPKGKEGNFGHDIFLPDSELSHVAQFDGVVVKPEFRRNALAMRLNEHALTLIDRSKYYHLCVTVAPNNYSNVKSLLNTGMVVKHLKSKFGGKLRFVMYKNLVTQMRWSLEDFVELLVNDIGSQREFLMKRGYVGTRMSVTDGEYYLRYNRLLEASEQPPTCYQPA